MTAGMVKWLWASLGLPPAVPEYRFCADRKWRFDYAWPAARLALEVQGGIWTQGRHTRGAALQKEWEKLNTAAALGWRVMYCAPGTEGSYQLVQLLKHAIWTDEKTKKEQHAKDK